MSDDFLSRATLAQLHAGRLRREAQTCNDLARLDAIGDELEIVLRSLEDLRAEQIIASMPKPTRRWWRRKRDANAT